MNCAEIDRLLPAFADGEFEGSEEVEFEIHLAHCDRCGQRAAAQVAELQAFGSALRAKTQVQAPPELRDRVRQDVSHAHLTAQAQRYSVFFAVAAGVAGMVTGLYIFVMPEPVDAEALVGMSQRAGSLPSDFDPAGGDLAAFTARHVGFNPDVPTSGMQSVRILPLRGQNGIFYRYGAEPRRRFILMVFSELPEFEVRLRQAHPLHVGSREILLANHQGHNVAVVRKDGLVYSLVSDLDEQDIVELLRSIAAR